MPFQNLYNSIFNTNEPGESAVEMLEKYVERYPFFSLAHFFLLKNTAPGDPPFAGIAAKTAQHFNHPFYLYEQLHKTADLQVTTDNEFATVFHTPDVFQDEMMEVTDAGADDKIFPEEILADVNEEAVAHSPEENASPALLIETEPLVKPHLAADAASNAQPLAMGNLQVLPQATALEPAEKTDTQDSAIETGKDEPLEGPKEEPMFEPLFATDYFASQGIKLKYDAAPNDKLGKQLRSFTDWLKTMKKVHEGKLPAGSETLDLSVQKLAEKSNREEDVITETMAEVYLQQGKQQKAKEIYTKLSLLNPSKMAYFAAKIEQIQ